MTKLVTQNKIKNLKKLGGCKKGYLERFSTFSHSVNCKRTDFDHEKLNCMHLLIKSTIRSTLWAWCFYINLIDTLVR